MLNLAKVAGMARSLAPVVLTDRRVKGDLRPTQLPPEGDWRTWLILAGRGWGKSLTLANLIVTWAEEHPGCRIGLAARTSADLRDTILYGESGILTQATRPPRHVAQRRRLEWPNGSQAILLSADEPRQGRGHNFHYAAADELMAWPHPERPGSLWHNLRLATRLPGPLGTRLVAATTPLPSDLLRSLVDDAAKGTNTRVTRGRTEENAANLSPDFLTETRGQWEGTRWARQELDGEILGDAEGALWSRDVNLAPYKLAEAPPLSYVVVGVDPSVGDGSGCACGIVVVGVGFDGHLYVLADYTLSAGPAEWAAKVVQAVRAHNAQLIVAEGNNGGQLVKQVLLGVDPYANVVIVNARRGKRARAEPIALLYDKGLVHHVGGGLTKLEDEQVSWGAYSEASPNRIDALVWACTQLLPYTHDAVYKAEKARQDALKTAAELARDQAVRDAEAFRAGMRGRGRGAYRLFPFLRELSMDYETDGEPTPDACDGDWASITDPAALHSDLLEQVKALQGVYDTQRERYRCHLSLYLDRVVNDDGLDDGGLGWDEDRVRKANNVIASAIDTVHSHTAEIDARPTFETISGSHALQEKAKNLGRACRSDFELYNYDEAISAAELDALISDAGVLRLAVKGGAPCLERVLPYRLVVDPAEYDKAEPTTYWYTRPASYRELRVLYPDADPTDLEGGKILDASHAGQDGPGQRVEVIEVVRVRTDPETPGRRVAFTSAGILADGAYDYDFPPYLTLRWTRNPASFWGIGLTERLSGPQADIDFKNRKIREHESLIAGKWVIDDNSGITAAHMDDLPAIISKKAGTAAPQYINPPAVPGDVYASLSRSIDGAFAVSGVSQVAAQAEKEPGLDSGVALRTHAAITSKRFRVWQEGVRKLYATIGRRWAEILAKDEAIERSKKIVLRVGRGLKSLTYRELAIDPDQYRVSIKPVSALSNDPAARRQELQEFYRVGAFTSTQIMRLNQTGDLEAEYDLLTAPEELADSLLEALVETGRYLPPEPFYDLQLHLDRGSLYYQRCCLEGVDAERLALLRRYVQQCADLQALANGQYPTAAQQGEQPGDPTQAGAQAATAEAQERAVAADAGGQVGQAAPPVGLPFYRFTEEPSMAEDSLLAAAAQIASGGDDAPPPEPVGAPEEGEEEAGAGAEPVEPSEEDPKESGEEDEAGDEKKRKSQIDRAYARLQTKKRQAAQQLNAQRAELARERETIKRERDAASQFLQTEAAKIQGYERIVALAKQGDAALVEALGLDLEKLTLNYLERGTPTGVEKKAKSEIDALRAEIQALKDAGTEGTKKATAQQEAQWRLDQSRQFVQFAAEKADAYPYAAVAVESNAQGVADVAWQVRDLAASKGIRLTGEGILAEVESYYEELARRHVELHSKVQARRKPIGEQVTTQNPARGLASGPRRTPAATPRNTESLSDEERLNLAARLLRQANRRLRDGIGRSEREREQPGTSRHPREVRPWPLPTPLRLPRSTRPCFRRVFPTTSSTPRTPSSVFSRRTNASAGTASRSRSTTGAPSTSAARSRTRRTTPSRSATRRFGSSTPT